MVILLLNTLAHGDKKILWTAASYSQRVLAEADLFGAGRRAQLSMAFPRWKAMFAFGH